MLKALCIAAVAIVSTAAHSSDYTFSYTIANHAVVTGSFSGTASGTGATDITNLWVTLNDIPGSGLLPILSAGVPRMYSVESGSVVSATVEGSSFLFGIPHSLIPGAYTETFLMNASLNGSFIPFYFSAVRGDGQPSSTILQGLQGATEPSGWTLHQVAIVPEPETYAMLIAGLGLIGVVSRRRTTKPNFRIGLSVS